MAKKTTIKAATRARTGSGRLNQMRREGWLPSVIYGRGAANQNLKVDAKSFSELLARSSSENIVVNLEIDGEGTRLAFLQAIQHDPLSGSALHADFLAIDSNTEITAHIPAHLNGEAPGVKAGGVVEQYVHALEITCLPDDLPEIIELDIGDPRRFAPCGRGHLPERRAPDSRRGRRHRPHRPCRPRFRTRGRRIRRGRCPGHGLRRRPALLIPAPAATKCGCGPCF